MSYPITLSCVLPVYNAGRYLAPAVRSILAQTWGDFELIAVNDGSTDSSASELAAFARKDGRIRVLDQANAGIVAALNNGFAAARGQFVARMDADDLARPDRFARQLAYMEHHPDCVLLGSRVTMIDADGYPIGDMLSVAHGHDVIDAALLLGGWPVVHPAVLIRRDAYERVGGYRDGTCPHEDHDLFLRLAEVGRIENHPEPLLRYRRHLTSVTFAKSREAGDRMAEIIRRTLERRGRNPHDHTLVLHPKSAWSHRKDWVWQALREGHVHTARKHARGIVLERPWSKEAWRAAFCAYRGH